MSLAADVPAQTASQAIVREVRAGSPAGEVRHHGGPVLGSAQIRAVFWGTWPRASHKRMDQLLAGFGTSRYRKHLAEYGIGRTTYLGSASELADVPPAGSTEGQDGSAISAMVSRMRPVPQSVVIVYLRRPGEANVCAWHYYTGAVAIAAVYASPGCSPAVSTAHEITEALTDPYLTGWYGASPYTSEIADLCYRLRKRYRIGARTWQLDRVWSNRRRACV